MGVFSLIAEETANIPPDIERLIQKSRQQRQDTLKAKFAPIQKDLANRSDPRQFYLDAVFQVFFAKEERPDKPWRDWQKTNRGLVEDERLPLATETASLYLQGHLFQLMGREADAVATWTNALNRMASGQEKLTGFHLLQESLADSLLVKFYGIESEYLKEKDVYYGSLGDVEAFFTKSVLPWHEEHQPQTLGNLWDIAITAIGKASSLSEQKATKFAITEQPRLFLS